MRKLACRARAPLASGKTDARRWIRKVSNFRFSYVACLGGPWAARPVLGSATVETNGFYMRVLTVRFGAVSEGD